MKATSLKILLYIFLISITAGIIINVAADSNSTVFNIIKYSLFGIAASIILIYVYMMVYLSIDNKKIAKLLNSDDYDALIKHCLKKTKRYSFLFNDRKMYYNYLLLLSYLGKDETDKFDEYFEKVTDYYNYPVAAYWKSVYHFSIGIMEDLEANYHTFMHSPDIQKRHSMFINLIKILDVLVSYKNGKYEDALKELETVDTKNIAMPMTRRALEIVKQKENQTNN